MSRFSRSLVLMIAFAVAGAGAAARAQTAGGGLDPRLGAERERIGQTLAAAARDGLPVEILDDKLREGLAKGVPAPRIAVALARLSEALAGARAELAGRERPSARLYRAVVEAHAAGVGRAEVGAVLAATPRSDGDTTARAVEVLGDLARRGFPADVAARTVADVARARPQLIGQLVGEAEALRRSALATPVEALEALARAAQRSLRLDEAHKLLPRGPRDRGAAPEERGPDRETQGNRGRGRGN
jgi:hypothetical protein